MARAWIVLLAAVVGIAGCGSSNTPAGPTVASVSAQANDLPSGMSKCDLSGDIDHFIAAEQSPDAASAKSMSDDWQQAKKDGATEAYAALYTDGAGNCSAIKTSGADLAAATFKLVVNFVIRYKDDKSAAGAYRGENPILGFNPNELRTGGAGVVEGSKTGLGGNSIVLTQTAGNQMFYIAIWQNLAFVVILAILNVDANAARNAATRENSRIK